MTQVAFMHETNAHAGEQGSSAFHRRANELKVPLNVQVQLTDRCNLSCEFCYNSPEHKREELSFAEIDDLFGQLREAGTMYVTLTGGEPTLHPRFFDIARRVREHGMALELITNATLLGEAHFRLFEELKPRYVAVSLHGLQAASHERLTRSPHSFDRTKSAIETMVSRGIHVQLRIPITRYNFHELDELMTYADALGISHRMDCNITHREDGSDETIGPRMDDAGVSKYQATMWRQWLAANPRAPVIGHHPEAIDSGQLCAAGHTYCYIDSVGTLHPCPSYQHPAGSIREQRFLDIWQQSEFLRDLRRQTHGTLKGCSGCDDKPFCAFCPGDARNEGDDRQRGWAKYQRACDNAALNRKVYEREVLGHRHDERGFLVLAQR